MDIRVEDAGIEALRSIPNRTVQADPDWLLRLAPFIDAELRVLVACVGKQAIAWFPHWVRRHGFFTTVVTPYPFYYTPLILRAPERKRPHEMARTELTIVHAMAEALRHRYWRTMVRLLWDFNDCRGFQWAGWKVNPLYTYMIHLDTMKFDDLIPSHQTEYRKAERHGLRMVEGGDGGIVAELMRQSFQRQKKTLPLEFSRLQALARAMTESPDVRLYLAMDGDRPVAGEIYQIDPALNTAFAWMSGFDTAVNDGGIVFLRVKEYESLREHCKMVDICGANTPTIAQNKAGFGGELVPLYFVKHSRLILI